MPRFVIRPKRLAIKPSRKSVTVATAYTTAAHTGADGTPEKNTRTNTGTRQSRHTDSMFGKFMFPSVNHIYFLSEVEPSVNIVLLKEP